jgi:hypothetical protein
VAETVAENLVLFRRGWTKIPQRSRHGSRPDSRPGQTVTTWVDQPCSPGSIPARPSRHALRTDRIVLAVLGFCVCVTSNSFGQTPQPRQEDPKQEQSADSPEPLGTPDSQALFGGANTGARRGRPEFQRFGARELRPGRVDGGEPQLGGLTRTTGIWTTGGTVPACRSRR